MTKVKLCGIKTLEDVIAVNKVQPDYIGFVFVPRSKRFITTHMATVLRKRLEKKIIVIGVFEDAPLETIVSLLQQGIIDIVQLHGNEDEQYIKLLKQKTGKILIKAFDINKIDDLHSAYCSLADYVLFDSGNGGTGKIFDWDILKSFDRPYFLAGGLNISNICKVIDKLQPYAVDVSSGIETDGKKDSIKMAAFVEAVHNRI